MFTGIISDIGEIVALTPKGDSLMLQMKASYEVESVNIGASIACDGMCLTVKEKYANDAENNGGGGIYHFDISPESLMKTNAGEWKKGRKLNLERAMKAGDEFGGHMVTGHVDCVTKILAKEELEGAVRFQIATPKDYAAFIAPKGSITLNGTSLTVNEVFASHFEIMVIPHSLNVTTWGQAQIGDRINLEIDSFARYVSHYLEHIMQQKTI